MFKGAFHLSELTGQAIPVVIRISLLIKTIQLDQSNIACTKEILFYQKLLKKAYSIFKMASPAMVRTAASDFSRATPVKQTK